MKTQQQYYDEINNNLHKFNPNQDDFVKRRLRKLTIKNLEYVNSLLEEHISNITGRPSEVASLKASFIPIIKYINFLIKKKTKQGEVA